MQDATVDRGPGAAAIAQAFGRTAVIIPFFQRKPGLLMAAIRSALAQEAIGPITVMVCDDGSPISANTELAGLTPEQRAQVVLIRQANSGAGPARNAALNAVPPDAEWIAFLDSDDLWKPAHIARAVAALQGGSDLCFSDALRESQTLTHFQAAAFGSSHREPVTNLPGLFRFTGNFLTLNITMSPVSISTVVMRASTLGDLRFPHMAFEDLMFWFEVARRPVRIAFDITLQVIYGSGDITLTESWRSKAALKRCLLYHRIFKRVVREFRLTGEQRTILNARLAHNRRDFCKIVLARLRHGQSSAWPVVADFTRLDPRIALSLIGVTVNEVVRHMLFHHSALARRYS